MTETARKMNLSINEDGKSVENVFVVLLMEMNERPETACTLLKRNHAMKMYTELCYT